MRVFCGDEDWGVISPRERPTKLYLGGSVPFPHPTIMARRKVFDELKGYKVSELTRHCEDRELWYRFFGRDLQVSTCKKYYINPQRVRGHPSQKSEGTLA